MLNIQQKNKYKIKYVYSYAICFTLESSETPLPLALNDKILKVADCVGYTPDGAGEEEGEGEGKFAK